MSNKDYTERNLGLNQLNKQHHENIPRRYERKFLVTDIHESDLETIIKLNPNRFNEIYYQRQVNNIYFDTLEFDHYTHNVQGHFDRMKIRVRWYGQAFGAIKNPVLECKIKEGSLGYKLSYPIEGFNLNRNQSGKHLRDSLYETELPKDVHYMLKDVHPVLLNSYRRKYFQSACKHYRITIDSGLSYRQINERGWIGTFIYQPDYQRIVEMKYQHNHDQNADRISNHFPFIMTKSSKYIMGMNLLYE